MEWILSCRPVDFQIALVSSILHVASPRSRSLPPSLSSHLMFVANEPEPPESRNSSEIVVSPLLSLGEPSFDDRPPMFVTNIEPRLVVVRMDFILLAMAPMAPDNRELLDFFVSFCGLKLSGFDEVFWGDSCRPVFGGGVKGVTDAEKFILLSPGGVRCSSHFFHTTKRQPR